MWVFAGFVNIDRQREFSVDRLFPRVNDQCWPLCVNRQRSLIYRLANFMFPLVIFGCIFMKGEQSDALTIPAAPTHRHRHHQYSIVTLGQGKGKESPLRHGIITQILTRLSDTKTAPTVQSRTIGMEMIACSTMSGWRSSSSPHVSSIGQLYGD